MSNTGNMMKKKIFRLLLAVLLAAQAYAQSEFGQFYDENIGSLVSESLSNGIPLVVKKNPRSQIVSINLVIEGGAALETERTAGLEDATLEFMQRGSKGFSYDKIRSIFYEESASISGGSGTDYAVFSMSCIKDSMKRIFEVYEDSFFRPLFDKEEFVRLEKELRQDVVRKMNDPSSVMLAESRRRLFAGHPYLATAGLSQESLESVTMENVARCHKAMLDSRRLRFVAAGNFSDKEIAGLKKSLNRKFGKIPAGSYIRPEVPAIEIMGATHHVAAPNSGESGYICGFYAIPQIGEPDRTAYFIAEQIMDSIYHDIIREKNGLAYSAYSVSIGGRASAGGLMLYRAVQGGRIQDAIRQAQAEFPEGAELEVKVAEQKNVYINSVYSSVRTSAGIASSIISGLAYRDDAANYLKTMARIRAVTPGQVKAAFEKYIKNARCLWIVAAEEGSGGKFGL